MLLNRQAGLRTNIVRLVPHIAEHVHGISVGLEIMDKLANEFHQFGNILILLCGDDLLIDLLWVTRLQHYAFLNKFLPKVIQHRSAIFVFGESKYQVCTMFFMKAYLPFDPPFAFL